MPVGGPESRDLAGLPSPRGHDVNERVLAGRVANGEPTPVGRQAVVVVQAVGESRVNGARRAPLPGQGEEPPAPVEEKRPTITRPVGGLEMLPGGEDPPALPAGGGGHPQPALPAA